MRRIDLQRFAEEKTERATPKRRRDARRQGQVARSGELTSAVVLLAGIVVLRISAAKVWGGWLSFMTQSFGASASPAEWTNGHLLAVVHQVVWLMLELLGPVLGTVLVVGGAVGFAQVGPLFLPNLLLPKWSRVNPLEGVKRLWSRRTLVEAAKALVKLCITAGVAYAGAQRISGTVAQLMQVDVRALAGVLGQLMFQMVMEIAALFVVLAFLDYLFQRLEFERSIRMSREEIRQEYRQQEGNPIIRSQLRQRGRRLAMRRMMQEVPKADVVVTNPTHLAVALRYDAQTMHAPQVIAKGKDEIAAKIRETARSANVPVMENRPLARALYQDVEIGEFVPEALFRAVAEVLAAVYRMRQGSPRR
ncbi:MAG: flagellar biosynthesis protein FlhB [Alicyclobacillus sp.]|nr:flagellar biosynthesis protein FlhB [Alicyclobacillus sp.]